MPNALSRSLFTESQHTELLANGRAQRTAMDRQVEALDFHPVVRLFTPDGPCTWLLTELDTEGFAFGLCDLGLGYPELGSVSVIELLSVPGKWGLPLERDLHFLADKPISAYAQAARVHGYIVS